MHRCPIILCGLLVVGLTAASSNRAQPARAQGAPDATPAVLERGATIYANQCAQCHGDKGQGVELAYEKPFAGERSLGWLTRRIERTMPEGESHLCVGEDAAAVAAYIHDRFYKPSAVSEKPRELQRLTAEQHRQSLADLVGSFQQTRPPDARRGLLAKYYPSGRLTGKPIAEQLEPLADLRFTSDHPLADQFDPKGHSVRLTGSLLAPVTGEYELIVRTDRAVRLWFNNSRAQGGGAGNEIAEVSPAFLDGWVKSEGVESYRRKVFLIAGRAYPLLLDFSARNQGVQRDVNPNQRDQPETYLSLRWILPGQTERIIASRYLSPVRSAEVFVTEAPFPPDDASRGYPRGVGVSTQWLDAVTRSAIDTADAIEDDFNRLAGASLHKPEARPRVAAFLRQFIQRAHRRPLTDAQAKALIDERLDTAPDLATGLRRVVIATLVSPAFLYPDANRTPAHDRFDHHAVAARLALALHDGLPDAPLRQAADQGRLDDPAVLRQHARRLADDPRSRAKLRRFFDHWLELDPAKAQQADKDPDAYPAFDRELITDLRTSLDLFIEAVVFDDASDYRRLLLDNTLYVNDRLAELYQLDLPADAKAQTQAQAQTDAQANAPHRFAPVAAADHPRLGVITHPYLLTLFAYRDNTSPIHRGVMLTRSIVGRPLNPPPQAIAFDDHDFDPSLTMREKVTRLTSAPTCMACHATINPLGFALEHYDALGRYRTADRNNKPIDAASTFLDDEQRPMLLAGPRDIASFAANSDMARRSFVRQLVHHTLNRSPAELGPDTLDRLDQRFADSNTHIRKLFIEIALAEATQNRTLKWSPPAFNDDEDEDDAPRSSAPTPVSGD